MTMTETIEQALRDIQPLLAAAGRSVCVKTADETSCVIELKGFCQGGCACTESYVQGIEEIIRDKAPKIQTVQFETV